MTRAFALTTAERADLETLRDHTNKPHLRERVAALLKVDAGMKPARAASEGLLRPCQPDTVYRWLDHFVDHGIAGLTIRPGRGRKPAFSHA